MGWWWSVDCDERGVDMISVVFGKMSSIWLWKNSSQLANNCVLKGSFNELYNFSLIICSRGRNIVFEDGYFFWRRYDSKECIHNVKRFLDVNLKTFVVWESIENLLIVSNVTINVSVTVMNIIGAHIYTSHLKILVKKIPSDLFLSK